MKIATWNVNSLKVRLPQVLDWLAKHRPETLGQAARISGITPASISLLMIHLKKGGFKGFARTTEEQGA